MTIRKPPGKRLASLLLSLTLLLTLVPAMGTTASAANAAPSADHVFVDGNKCFREESTGHYESLYYKNNDEAYNFTGTADDYNAYYNPDTGVLTLNNYNGKHITVGGTTTADLIIKLVGTNTVTGTIENNKSGDLTITGDGSLTVNNVDGTNVYGIAAGFAGTSPAGSVTITDNAKVTVNVTNNSSNITGIYGIYAKQSITVSKKASVDITCRTPSTTSKSASCYGMFVNLSNNDKLTIDTDGNIQINATNAGSEACSFGLCAPSYTLTKVGSMEVQWKGSSGGAIYGGGAFDDATHAVNVDTSSCYASYRYGTPYAVTVAGGRLTGPGVVANANNYGNFLAGDTVKLTAPTRYADSANTVKIPFDKWVSNDVTITNGNSQAASFAMPSKDVAVRANYDPFTVQPTFTRATNYPNQGTVSFTLVSGDFDSIGKPDIYPVGSSTPLNYSYTSDSATKKTFTVYKNDCPDGQYVVGVSYNGVMCYSEPFRVKYTTPSASVAEEVTVSGKAGEAISEASVVVTLENDTFASTLPDGKWIQNLPAGLSQSVTRTDERTATITITGTPKVGCTADMEILIPKGALVDESGESVKVSIGGKAKFNITSNAPTADKIKIGGTAFPDGNSYYKNGTDGAFGGFTGTSSDYNAKYDPQTGTLTLSGYDGPYIKINGDASQTVTVKLEGNNNKVGSEWDHAIWLVGGVNLRITADSDAILTLTGGTNYCGIGSASASDVGFVTISGSANVTINASTDNSLSPAYGIRSGKDVAVLGGASLKITCSSDGGTIKGYGIYTPSGKVTVNTTGTVDINASRCANSDTYCIYANSIAFKNAEKIMLTYASVCSPTYPGASLTDRFDASGMKSPKTTADSATGVTTVTYAKLGAKPAKPRIKLPSNNQDDITGQNFLITLEHDDSSVKIYYTTDGTSPTTDGKTPTKDSIQYEAPFNVGKSCTVKAVAYSEGDEQCSDVVEQVLKWHRYKINKTTAGVTVCDEHGNPFPDGIEPWTKVYIKAPPTRTSTSGEEQIFVGWNEISNATINDPSANETYFIMPYQDISITARYDKAPDGVTVSGQVTSYGNAAEAVTVTLTKSGESTPAQTVTISAPGSGSAPFVQDYSFSAVPDGTYTLKVEKKGHAPRTEEITVENTAITKDVTVYLIGDVNGDGRVNGTDKAILTRYLANWPGYKAYVVSMAAADINQDGTVNGTDKAILIRYLAGYSSYNSFFE